MTALTGESFCCRSLGGVTTMYFMTKSCEATTGHVVVHHMMSVVCVVAVDDNMLLFSVFYVLCMTVCYCCH